MIVRYCGGSVWMNWFFFVFCVLGFLFFSFLFFFFLLFAFYVLGESVLVRAYIITVENKMGLPLPKDLSSSECEVTRS